jgi:hypothetical protein
MADKDREDSKSARDADREESKLLALPDSTHLPAISEMSRADFTESSVPLLGGTAYADNMVEHIEAVFKQTEAGLQFADRLTSTMDFIASREVQTYTELESFITEEIKTANDKMVSATAAYKSLLEGYLKAAKQRKKVGQIIVHKVCHPMKLFLEQEKVKLLGYKKSFVDFAQPIPALLTEIETSRANCLKAIKMGEEKSILKKRWKWSKVFEICRQFDERRTYANQYLQSFHDIHIPQMLTSLQRIEERRLAAMVNIFDTFSHAFEDQVTLMAAQIPKLRRVPHLVDIGADIEDFVVEITEKFPTPVDRSPASRMSSKHARKRSSRNMTQAALLEVNLGAAANREVVKYVPYGLDYQLVEIEKKAYMETARRKGKKPPMDITDSPEFILAQQHKCLPEFRMLTMPRIFLALKVAVEDLGGFEKEGIFRISSEYADIDKVFDKLRAADFDVELDDPHVAANCLKKWLRELNDSLVPQEFIEQVLEALDIATRDLKSSEKKMKQIFEQLPQTNQLIVKGLLRLMRDISYQDNVLLTKMTMPNLAVVFGPSFLRFDDLNDPKKAFRVADAAQQLILMWVHLIDVSDYPVEQERLAAFPGVVPVKISKEWKRAPLGLNYNPSVQVMKMGEKSTPISQEQAQGPLSPLPASPLKISPNFSPSQSPKSSKKKKHSDAESDEERKNDVNPSTINAPEEIKLDDVKEEKDDTYNANEDLVRKWSSNQLMQSFGRQRSVAHLTSPYLGMMILPVSTVTASSTIDLERDSVATDDGYIPTALDTAKLIVQLPNANPSSEKKEMARITEDPGSNPEDDLEEEERVVLSVEKQLPKRPSKKPTSPLQSGEKPRVATKPKQIRRAESNIARVARCWKCQAKAVNSEFCVNCWSPLDPLKAAEAQDALSPKALSLQVEVGPLRSPLNVVTSPSEDGNNSNMPEVPSFDALSPLSSQELQIKTPPAPDYLNDE